MSASRTPARRTSVSVLVLGALLGLVLAGEASGAPGDATPSRVADIRPGPTSSNPEELFDAGGTLLFAADDGVNGNELWKSNGGPLGPGGTEMIEMFGGINGSVPRGFTDVGGTVFFTADDPVNGGELRRIAPPFTTPTLVENIGPTIAGASNILADVNGTLFFVGNDGATGDELWKSAPPYDQGSTEIVEDINATAPGASSSPNQAIGANGTLLFTADEDGTGDELWRSVPPYDSASTAEIEMGPGPSFPAALTNLNGTILFSADDGSADGFELWKIAPPYTTPAQVEDINAAGDGNPDDLVNVNGTLFFKADDGTAGEELWKSVPPFDAAGTSAIEIRPGPDGSGVNFLEEVGGTLFFRADDGVRGAEPWRSNGGPLGAGTQIVADIDPGSGGSSPLEFEGVNGTAFFRAFGPVAGLELWKSNGVGATAVPTPVSAPNDLTDVGGTLFFEAIDGGGQELWKATIEGPAQSNIPGPAPAKKKKCKKKGQKKGQKAAPAKKKKKCKKKRKKRPSA